MMKYGGLAAKNGKGPLWKFTDKNDGSFTCPDPEYISSLYFPIMNEKGMRCWVTPELKGDIASGYHFYFNTPTVTDELWRSSSSRNIWISAKNEVPWSATGVSADRNLHRWNEKNRDESFLEAGIGWFQVKRESKDLKLKATTTIFVPSDPDQVEIIIFKLENTGKKSRSLKVTSAIPMFGRSTENVRDHKQVTTLFQRIWIEKEGVRIKGNIVHDERGGHLPNNTYYASYGFDEKSNAPQNIWGSMLEFIGEGGTLDNPEALWKDHVSPKHEEGDIDGTEAIGALQFGETELEPGESVSYVIINCISEQLDDFEAWKKKYNSPAKAREALRTTKEYWQKLINNVSFNTHDDDFNNWCRWVSFQLKCRQVYGNAYLPDFDYGKGGRGWRDLWQDLLSIFLIDPASAREELVNNFLGVRIDGTNANLIGNRPGEFFSDVNKIDRTWCDHSAWPTFVTNFYIQQSGDYDILMKKVPYWKDHVLKRSKDVDKDYHPESYGSKLKDYNDNVYEGTILEHLIMQNVCSFYNVGKNNNILLGAADWNDTYDNARERGESVCFYNFFAHNLDKLAMFLDYFKAKGWTMISLLQETLVLFDQLPGQQEVDYSSPEQKQYRLDQFHESVRHKVSGHLVDIAIEDLIKDFRAKAAHAYEHIRTNEWITTSEGLSFFNGHYDNDSIRIHGDHPNGVRIDLTSQVMPVICGTATNETIPVIYNAVKHYLEDKTTGGLRLNTDLKELKLNLGRVCAFAYGYKEHGSKWMHQNIMFLYGLYSRGFVKEGYEVFKGIYDLVMDSGRSKIFPSVPSFFNKFGHGMYVYLTGSAAWFILSFATQVFGIRGENGDLCINPKLVKEQFDKKGKTELLCFFRNKRLKVIFNNPVGKEWNEYDILQLQLNGQLVSFNPKERAIAILNWTIAEPLLTEEENTLIVDLI